VDLAHPPPDARHLADLVTYLPPGCALWRATGGPLAWSDEVHALMEVEFGLRVLAWQKSEDGAYHRNPPKRIPPPPLAGEVQEGDSRITRRIESWEQRRRRRR
jgi:hypothetical protein